VASSNAGTTWAWPFSKMGLAGGVWADTIVKSTTGVTATIAALPNPDAERLRVNITADYLLELEHTPLNSPGGHRWTNST